MIVMFWVVFIDNKIFKHCIFWQWAVAVNVVCIIAAFSMTALVVTTSANPLFQPNTQQLLYANVFAQTQVLS